MPRTTLLSTIALACACTFGAGRLSAQSPTATPDSASQVRTLQPVRVSAKARATREGVLALMDENRRLMGELYRQDRKIDSLSRRLAYIRGPLTEQMNKDIERMNDEAAQVRARREALEARLGALAPGGDRQ